MSQEQTNSTHPLIFLELNELNFEMIQHYTELGYLPNFKKLLQNYALNETVADVSYEHLGPEVQWTSIHTGQSYDKHQISNLGEITEHNDLKQIWEALEEQGYSVGAFAPMNAANRTQKPKFWLPNPYIDTPVSGESWLKNLASANKQAFNEEKQGRLSTKAKTTLAHILLTKTQKTQWPSYLTNAYKSLFQQCQWAKALILDRLLTDAFIQQWNKYTPDFATIYLSAGSYFQHHYWFNSKVYNGPNRNPIWYIKEDSDPLLDVYQMYDQIISDIVNLPARIIIATGLTQVPQHQVTYFYNLEDPEHFITNLGLEFSQVTPHGSRGLYIECKSKSAAQKAERTMRQLFSNNDEPLFDYTNLKDMQVYTQLTYPHEIKSPFPVKNAKGEIVIDDFATEVTFIKIANTHKDKKGYYIDSAIEKNQKASSPIQVEKLYDSVMNHFNQSS